MVDDAFLRQSYDVYPVVEEQFGQALAQSLDPSGPGGFSTSSPGSPGQPAPPPSTWAADIQQFGTANYDIALGDCLWHIYRMIGKLSSRVYLLSRPSSA